MRLRSIALALAVTLPSAALVAFGCGTSDDAKPTGSDGGGNNVVPGSDAAVQPGADAGVVVDSGPPPPCPAPPLPGTFAATISAVSGAMNIPNTDAGVMTVPSDADRDAFAQAVLTALVFDGTSKCPLPPSYGVFSVKDQGDDVRVVAELDAKGKPAPKLFWGTYAARRPGVGTRDVVIEAPHPVADSNTDTESATVFSSARAELYLLAGAHRCANPNASGCDGTTDACSSGTNNPYRDSDAAHSVKTPFWAMHAAISAAGASPFVQLHGNTATCPDALLADGSGSYSDAGITAQLANALEAQGAKVGRCGAGYPTAKCTLCATDNVEARFSAGAVTTACTAMGTTYGRLVHIEQQPALRSTPKPLLDAINATFPARK
jgi:hypothetical protein